MRLDCLETLGFQLRKLAEKRDAEGAGFVVTAAFVERRCSRRLINNKYGCICACEESLDIKRAISLQ